jgi:hypothetical protein
MQLLTAKHEIPSPVNPSLQPQVNVAAPVGVHLAFLESHVSMSSLQASMMVQTLPLPE